MATRESLSDHKDEFRRIIGDELLVIKPAIFWVDMLLNAGLGWMLFAVSMQWSSFSLGRILVFSGSVVCLYRAVVFTHELVHLPRNRLPGFRLVWNLCCGIPLLCPHFLYRRTHLAHHTADKYSTDLDGEYVAFQRRPVAEIMFFLCSGLALPLLGICRFGLLTPLSLCHVRLRNWVSSNASSMGVRVKFVRDTKISRSESREWIGSEFGCWLFITASAVLGIFGVLPIQLFVSWYILVATIVTLNAIRAIGCTHHYQHATGHPITWDEQVLDSINVPNRSPITLILCPVGTRFHALHHIFPAIPYHSLAEANRRLVEQLPQDSAYRTLNLSSLWDGWQSVWPKTSSRQTTKTVDSSSADDDDSTSKPNERADQFVR